MVGWELEHKRSNKAPKQRQPPFTQRVSPKDPQIDTPSTAQTRPLCFFGAQRVLQTEPLRFAAVALTTDLLSCSTGSYVVQLGPLDSQRRHNGYTAQLLLGWSQLKVPNSQDTKELGKKTASWYYDSWVLMQDGSPTQNGPLVMVLKNHHLSIGRKWWRERKKGT